LVVATGPSAEAAFPGSPGRFFLERSGDIYVTASDGSAVTRLTFDSKSQIDPAVSPDGRKVAYAGNQTGDWDIYVMNADGTGTVNLTKQPNLEPGDEYAPSWSPDGKKLLYIGDGEPVWDEYDGKYYYNSCYYTSYSGYEGCAIYSVDSFTGGAKTMLHPYGDSPVWSPDGQRILFGSEGSLYSMDPSGGSVTKIKGGSDSDSEYYRVTFPSWSPDGLKIAFEQYEDIYVMTAGGGDPVRLTHQGGTYPRWSPAGNVIAFLRDGRIQSINPDGTDVKAIGSTATNVYAFDWAPCPSGENCAGAPAAIPSPAPSPTPCVRNTRLTLTASRSSLTYGDPVNLLARLEAPGATYRDVSIHAKPVNGTSVVLGGGAVDSFGEFSVTAYPQANTDYLAVYSGCDGVGATKSSTMRVSVAPKISQTVARHKRISQGKYMFGLGSAAGFTSTVRPVHSGQNLAVQIERRSPNGWGKYASRSFSMNSLGKVSVKFTAPGAGTYRIRSLFKGDSDHAAAGGAWMTLKFE
jgi:Tol biopolymer transport system component